MVEIKMTQEEFEILDRILSGLLHGTERLAVIAAIDKEGFSRRPELDEELLYNFLLSLGGDLQFAYIYKGQTGNPARDVAKAICSKFRSPDASNEQAYEWGYADGKKSVGQPALPTGDVGELVEALQYILNDINSLPSKTDLQQSHVIIIAKTLSKFYRGEKPCS